MKARLIIYNIFIAASIFLFSRCEKYLDKNPDMRAELNTVDKIRRMVTSAYPNRNYLAMAETYSDNVEDKAEGSLDEPLRSLYFWEDIDDNDTNTPTNYWNACYGAIAAANQALEAIEDGDFGEEVIPYKGEALIARAYAHFMLVTFFAQPFDPQGDNTSPGIPYVEEPETIVFKDYDRGTVASVYDKIRRDLEEGLPLLAKGSWTVPKYHFTPSSANAFASRFYLFSGEWEKVIQASNTIFIGGDFSGKLRPYNSTFKNIPFAQYHVDFTKADQSYNLLLMETYSTYQRFTGSRYAMGVSVFQNVYNAPTAAGAPFYNYGLNYGVPHYTSYKWREHWHVSNPAANIGFPYLMFPALTADEVLMNRAEAYVQLGQYDRAMNDLNLFASNYVNNYNPANHMVTIAKSSTHFNVSDDKQALLETILEFKRIAFIQEGIRWFDIIRHNLDVAHTHVDQAGAETVKELKHGDPRRVFQIPNEAKMSNVEQNPR